MSVSYPRALVRILFLLDPGISEGERRAMQRAVDVAREALGYTPRVQWMDWGAVYQADVTPVRLQVRRNPYYEADECECVFDYKWFPFDPRLARSAAVEAHIWDAGGLDEGNAVGAATRRFVGWADEGDWEPTDDHAIRLRCRDNTALLIDQGWGGELIALDRPLDAVLRDILDRRLATSRIGIEVRSATMPVLEDERGDANGNEQAASTRESMWDVIVRLCSTAGLVCWVDGDRLIVAPGQTVTTATAGTAFVYGGNLSRLKLTKGLMRRRSKPVLVRSWNPTLRRTLWAVWPDPGATDGATEQTGDEDALSGRMNSRSAVGTTTAPPVAEDRREAVRYVEYTLQNDLNQASLDRAARNLYMRTAQSDVEAQLETREMAARDGGDLLDLRAGDPIRIWMSDEERGVLHERSVSDRIAYLTGRGYSGRVAEAIARGYDALSNLYQLTEVELNYDAQGFELRARAVDYLLAGEQT